MVQIKKLAVEVPGRVTRGYDAKTDKTELTLDEAQVTALHDQLDSVMSFFNSQNGSVRSAD